ncbi:hypothetical protein KSC_043540 [Ktedonobacter sp. SOSP1-52]|uniref:hypothetical protein n=1 Tax=Ktedonobacter sp. SOSP1-52 TaxID=2778366 RepID=UPI001914F2E1|nr:hypothetical protein [Ktedonobacter sp. SOSP1-52]GHO65462.1 hypothetical protein KSC_043540 [Ktedonobacter sp. SOSP1-52]
MNDKSFMQTLDELNLKAHKEIADETIQCWMRLQQPGATVAGVTTHIENVHMREMVSHLLFYILLQTLFYHARHHDLISNQRYEELRTYIDGLTDHVKKQPFMIYPFHAT